MIRTQQQITRQKKNNESTNTTKTPNKAEERIKQFNKTLEQIMIRRESSSEDDKKNGKQQQPTVLPEAFYKSYSMTLPKTLKGSSKKKHSRNSS